MIGRSERKSKRAVDPSWGPPVPLSLHRDLPEFPVHVLPLWLAKVVAQTSETFQVPPEFPALYVLALVSVAASGKFVIRVRDQWELPLTLYVIVALPPGERKTPVIEYLTKPIHDWDFSNAPSRAEQRSRARAREQQARAAAESALAQLKTSREEERQTDLAQAHADAVVAYEAAAAAVPAERRSIIEFATPEALEVAMHANEGRQAIISDEGAGVLSMTNRYSRHGGANVDLLLKGYDGVRYVSARVTRPCPPIDPALLTIALGAQPEAIKRAVNDAPELYERGLLARIIVALPTARVGTRRVRTRPISKSAESQYQQRMTRLIQMPGRRDASGKLARHRLVATRKASKVMFEFQERIEPMMAPGRTSPYMTMWLAKLSGQVGRLAALLHVADHAGSSVPSLVRSDVFKRAVEIADFLVPHAEALGDMLVSPPELEAARRVLAWIVANGRASVSEREILRGTRGAHLLKSGAQRDAVMAILDQHGYVRRLPSHQTGPGRPTRRWEVHPDLLPQRKECPRVC